MITSLLLAAALAQPRLIRVQVENPETQWQNVRGETIRFTPAAEVLEIPTPLACDDNAEDCARAASEACGAAGGTVDEVTFRRLSRSCSFRCSNGSGSCSSAGRIQEGPPQIGIAQPDEQ